MKKIYQNITLILILFVLGTIHIQAQRLTKEEISLDGGHDEFLLGNPVAVIKPKRPTPCDCKHLGNLDFTYSRSLNIALANDRRIIAAEREKAIKWYNKQTKLLHGFLNSFTGYSPTYTEARNKLFKASEQTNINIHRPTVARKFQSLDYNAGDAKRKSLYGLKALQQRAREIRDGNINNSLYADIVVNGIALKNIKTIAAITKESKKINSNNILRNKLWQAHRYKFLHDLVKSNNHRFLEVVKQEAARRKNGIHNGYNVWDKLNYMQLLIHNERIKRHGVLQVPYSPQQAITFQKFKNKVDVVTAQLIEELAKKQYTGNKMSVTHPEYWKVIWKQKYNNNIFKKVAAVEEYVRLANEACNKAINNTSVGSNLSVDYLVNQLKITDKNQYAWLNANPQKAIVYEKQIKNYVKGSASSEFGNTLGGNLNLSNGNNLFTDPTSSIKSDIVNGGLVQGMINDLGISNFQQKKWLYNNSIQANDLRSFVESNKTNGTLSNEFKKFAKDLLEAKRVLAEKHTITSTGQFSDEISSCCPGNCCPKNTDDRIINEYGIKPIQSAIDGAFNLISTGVAFVRGEEAFGSVIRSYLLELKYDIPSDVTNKQLGELFRIRKKNGIIIVEYKPGFLRSLLDLGLDTIDVIAFVSPSKGAGGFLATRAGAISAAKLTGYLRKLSKGEWKVVNETMSDAAKSYQEFVTKRKWNESFVLNGIKFDGLEKIVLTDAKSGMLNFVNADGTFKSFFTGTDEIIKQARRQRAAADDLPIEWHFEHKIVRDAFEKLLRTENLNIIFKHTPR